MAYTFDLSRTKDVEAGIAGAFTAAASYLSGFSIHVALLAGLVAAGGVIGYSGFVPKAA